MSSRDRATTRDNASDSTRDSASAGELDIIEKLLHPHCLLVHKVQDIELVLEIELMLRDRVSARDSTSASDSVSDSAG